MRGAYLRIFYEVVIVMIQNLLHARQAQQNRDEEPEETRRLSKSQLHSMVSERWLVPSRDSKGVCRRWLLSQHIGLSWRVEITTIRRFEVEVPARLQKKACMTNLADLLARLNSLLQERGEATLGFQDHMIPEEDWLIRVCRYIDQTNILGAFVGPVPGAQLVPGFSQRYLTAQTQAQQYLFGDNLLNNSHIFNSVKAVAEAYKRLLGLNKDLEETAFILRSIQQKFNAGEASLATLLMTASTTVLAHGHNLRDPDRIYVEGEEGQQFRLQLNEVNNM